MSSNRSVPIVIINSENIPNKIRNIDDIEYELSQVNSSGQKSTPTRKSKGRSLIKCKSFDFISRIRCILFSCSDKSAPPIPTVNDENFDIKEQEITRVHIIPRFPVRHGSNC